MGLNVVTLTPGSGYGDAGCEYIAGLHALGVPVTWTPTMANSAERLGWDCSCRHLHESIREPLLALWRRPLACNAILVNIPPVLLAKLLAAEITEPLNLGSSERVTINQLVDIVEEIAGVRLQRSYNLTAPKGVNGRNSDNTRIQTLLGWQPGTTLSNGLEATYRWIYDLLSRDGTSD